MEKNTLTESIAQRLGSLLMESAQENLPKVHRCYWMIAGSMCYHTIILGNFSKAYSSPEAYLGKRFGWSRFLVQKWASSFDWVQRNCPEIIPGEPAFERLSWERLPEESQIYKLVKQKQILDPEEYELQKEAFLQDWFIY